MVESFDIGREATAMFLVDLHLVMGDTGFFGILRRNANSSVFSSQYGQWRGVWKETNSQSRGKTTQHQPPDLDPSGKQSP